MAVVDLNNPQAGIVTPGTEDPNPESGIVARLRRVLGIYLGHGRHAPQARGSAADMLASAAGTFHLSAGLPTTAPYLGKAARRVTPVR